MNINQDRDPARGAGGGERGGTGGGEEIKRSSTPASGSADPATTNNNNHPSGSGGASSAMAATTTTQSNPKSSAAATTARSSSTESEGNARRGYANERRSRALSDDDDDEKDEEEDNDDDERARGGDSDSGAPSPSSGEHHQSLASSSTSGSPVRRLPAMLRPPHPLNGTSSQGQQQGQPQLLAYGGSAMSRTTGLVPSPLYGAAHMRQQLYYGTSPTDASTPTGASPSTTSFMDTDRSAAPKRRLPQGDYPSSSPSMMPPQQQSSNLSAAPSTTRALYEASHHHPSSNSSSSTARSGSADASIGMSSSHHHSQQRGAMDDDDDDDNEDPLRFETRGSHGPRDEARYETWTSKQLRKKCSHLKLRGLKNVKKHVMVEALYRYYRNQRAKVGATDGAGSNGMLGRTSSSSSSNHMTTNGHPASATSGGRALSSNRNDDSAIYSDSYAQQQQQRRYEQSVNAPSVGSSYLNMNGAGGIRGNRLTTATQSLNAGLQPTARRSSPSSLSNVARNSIRASSGGGSLPGASSTFRPALDVEEHKYESHDNEVRITSEDVIRLVDVILSPEFVDRLSSELSRWQFWVDVREKYVSLVNMNGPSSYGAARGLTALGGDHHTQDGARQGGGASSSVDNLRVPISSTTYVRPSAKWSSMQLWEMWKELTFAYTKTCFEFTAAGVDERNYIQFCEGRPDVFYLHQRLHARPDLLHLIKSNEYIEEKCSSDAASEHTNMNVEKSAANALIGVSSPVQGRPHKRFKRIVPAGSSASVQGAIATANAGSQAYGGAKNASSGNGNGSTAAHGDNHGAGDTTSGSDNAPTQQVTASKTSARSQGKASSGIGGGPAQYLAASGMRGGSNSLPNGQQEEGSTENSETTGEEGSMEKSNSNATSSDSTRREALAEQKYFGLLLQNFEAIFESLHNKKVLLAALRTDASAPDHLIADLHDDIHVLSALKKDFRNKLHQALE